MNFKIFLLTLLAFSYLFAFFGGGHCPTCICQEHSSVKSETALSNKQKAMIEKINKELIDTIKKLEKLKNEKKIRLQKLKLIYKLKLKNTILLTSINNKLKKQEKLLFLKLKKINLFLQNRSVLLKKRIKNDIIFEKNQQEEKK